MDLLWEHGMPHDPHLGRRILRHTGAGRTVVWISTSGTIQFFAPGGMCGLTRTRVHGGPTAHIGDEWPLESPGLQASSCGCWDATGYASTPPLLVAVLSATHDVETAAARARTLAAGWTSTVPDGHPDGACGAHVCLATIETTHQDVP